MSEELRTTPNDLDRKLFEELAALLALHQPPLADLSTLLRHYDPDLDPLPEMYGPERCSCGVPYRPSADPNQAIADHQAAVLVEFDGRVAPPGLTR